MQSCILRVNSSRIIGLRSWRAFRAFENKCKHSFKFRGILSITGTFHSVKPANSRSKNVLFSCFCCSVIYSRFSGTRDTLSMEKNVNFYYEGCWIRGVASNSWWQKEITDSSSYYDNTSTPTTSLSWLLWFVSQRSKIWLIWRNCKL